MVMLGSIRPTTLYPSIRASKLSVAHLSQPSITTYNPSIEKSISYTA